MSAFDPEVLLDAAAASLDLEVPVGSRAAVAANLVRLHALAVELLAFDLPPTPATDDRADDTGA